MKRMLLLVLVFMSALSGCSSAEKAGETSVYYDGTLNIYNDGEFFTNYRNQLFYIDFTTMQSAYVCPKPNCKHDNPNDCTSFGMSNHPIAYDGKLYYFTNEISRTEDGAKSCTTVWRADIDGTNRVKMCSMDELSFQSYDHAVLVGSRLYFTAAKVFYDEFGNSTTFSAYYFMSYDFADNSLTNIKKLGEGYNGGAIVCGELDGKVYLSCSYSSVELPYEVMMDFDAFAEAFEKNSVKLLETYDISTGDTTEVGEVPVGCRGGYLIYWDSETKETIVVNAGRNEITISGFGMGCLYTIVNDIIFSMSDSLAYDLKTNEMHRLIYGNKYMVVYYIDGKYILRTTTNDSKEYIAVTEDELIGTEIV